jgi:hypothetical protein
MQQELDMSRIPRTASFMLSEAFDLEVEAKEILRQVEYAERSNPFCVFRVFGDAQDLRQRASEKIRKARRLRDEASTIDHGAQDTNARTGFDESRLQTEQVNVLYPRPKSPRPLQSSPLREDGDVVATDPAKACAICMHHEKRLVLAPCLHRCICKACWEDWKGEKKCPLCRAEINQVLDIFE